MDSRVYDFWRTLRDWRCYTGPVDTEILREDIADFLGIDPNDAYHPQVTQALDVIMSHWDEIPALGYYA